MNGSKTRGAHRLTIGLAAAMAAATAIASGCDWRDFDDLKKKVPVVTAGAPSGFGPSGDFGRVVLPIEAPSDVPTVAARYVVSGITATGLSLVELDAAGNPTSRNIAGPELESLGGHPIVSLAEIPGATNGKVLMGALQQNLLGGGRVLVLSLVGDLIVDHFAPAEELNLNFGFGVAAANFAGAPAADYVVLTDEHLYVYLDGSPGAPLMTMTSAACPIALSSTLPVAQRQSRAIATGAWGPSMQIAVGTPAVTGKGTVSIFDVSASGVTCALTLTGNEPRFGQSIAAGHFDGDSNLDLLVGAPPDHAYLFLGPLSAGTVGVPLASPTGGVGFGAAVAAVNVDGMGPDEAVVGDPDTTIEDQMGAGRVVVFGSAPPRAVQTQVSDRYPGMAEGYGSSVGALRFCRPPGGCAATDVRRLLLVGATAKTFTFFKLGPADTDLAGTLTRPARDRAMRLSTLLAPDLEETLRSNPAHAAELADELHASDLAELIDGLADEQAAKMLAALPIVSAAAALDAMDHTRRQEIVARMDRGLAARIAESMSADERADLFRALPDEIRADLLALMPKHASLDVRELIRYPESSAGGLMTTDFVALDPQHTVERAIDDVRRTAAEKETIYEAYAVDPNGTLLGVVSLRDLVLARAGQPISVIMNSDVISVPPEMDQEDVARLFAHYDMLALPVVDAGHKILGIVTVDDVVNVLKQEQAEDIQKLGAVQPTEEPYFQTEFWTFVKKRAVWLIVIFMGEILTASVLEHYEHARKAFSSIEVFVPLIISSGGNTGSQASSLVIRGLALGEFAVGDAVKILWREVRMGLVLGGILGVIGLLRAVFVGHSGHGGMAAAVGLSLIACVTFGSVVGAGLPLFIKRLGFDPAVSSGPFIASLVDVLGIIIYLKIALTILGG